MERYFTCFLLLLILPSFAHLAFGQDDNRLILRGVVVDADRSSPLPYVHIREKSDRLASATDINGQFNVSVNLQDTIVFTSVGYQPFLFVPSDSTEESLLHLVISMLPQVQELQEVTVKAYDDITKFIRREEEPFSMNRPKGTPLFERKEPKEQKAIRMASGTNGAALEGAVTAFANLFNDKYQQEKKLKKLLVVKEAEEQEEYLQTMMTERYQKMVAQANSELSEAEIHQFTMAYMPPAQYMFNLDDYTLMHSILINLEKFQPEGKRSVAIEELLKTKVFEGDVPAPQ